MKHSRSLNILVIVVLCGILAVPLPAIGTGQTTDNSSSSAYVTVGNISVSPGTPEPGETVTITAAFRNSENSGSGVEITQASLRSGLSRRDTADNLGGLGAGDSIEVPFSTTFDSAGEKKLTAMVRGISPDGSVFVVEKPIYVDVEQSSGVSLAFSTVYDTDTAVGAKTPINVTIANGDSESITGVQLDLNGSTVENPNRVRGSIDTGSEETFQYDVTFDNVGTRTLAAEVTYTTVGGVTRTTTKSTEIEVVEPEVRSDLSARTTSNGNTEVELTNFGNARFTDVEIAATANDEVVAQNLMGDIDPESNGSVTVDIPSAVDGSVTYTATYTAAGRSHRTVLQDRSLVSGEVRLVSVASSRSGSGVSVQGDAANVGSTTAESVLLTVGETDDVNPTAPTGEYYVGEIEGSEFGTFELTAETESTTASIPVEITYVVDGERVTATQDIDIGSAGGGAASGDDDQSSSNGDEQGPSATGPGSSDGGLPVAAIGVVLVLLVVAIGFGGYRWRNQ